MTTSPSPVRRARLAELPVGTRVYVADLDPEHDVTGTIEGIVVGEDGDSLAERMVAIRNGDRVWLRPAEAIARIVHAPSILGIIPTGRRVCICVADWHQTRSFITGITGRHFGMPELGNRGVVVTDDDGHEHMLSRYSRAVLVPDDRDDRDELPA